MRPKTLNVAAGLVLLGAGAVGVLRFAGGSPAERGLEGVLGALALAGVLAAPAVAALVAYGGAPRVLIGAGGGLAMVAVTASIATWPLLAPAVVILSIGVSKHQRGGGGLGALVVLVAVPAALLVLFMSEDPRSWSGNGSTGSTSDTIAYAESLVSLALSGTAVAAARLAAARGMLAAPARS